MMPLSLPPGHSRIKRVASFDELINTRFADEINALCWPRNLEGDFAEVVERLAVGPGLTPLEDARLQRLLLRPAGRAAVEILLEDQRLLRAHGLEPVLECVNGYPPVAHPGPLRTDVCSFHVDTATDEADTWLCTYAGPSSEGLPNEEARRHVDLPETRAMLLRAFGGKDDEAFLDYLSENYFDLHYAAPPQARPYTFGQGHFWRIAIDYPGSPVPPCIHRAPDPVPGQPPRLLLIS